LLGAIEDPGLKDICEGPYRIVEHEKFLSLISIYKEENEGGFKK
jgi:hypothetical protein